MVNAVKHSPPPVEPPPATYDLIGLSEDEAHALMALVGACNSAAHADGLRTYPIYQELARVLSRQLSGSKYTVADYSGRHLTVHLERRV